MRYLLLIGATKTGPRPRRPESATLQAFMRFSEEAQKAGKTGRGRTAPPEAEARRGARQSRPLSGHRRPLSPDEEALGASTCWSAARARSGWSGRRSAISEGGYVDVRPVWQM